MSYCMQRYSNLALRLADSFFFVSHALACLLNACLSPSCLRVVSLHP